MKTFALALCVPLLTGCATVIRGTTDQVTFNSNPVGAQVATSDGHACGATPCTISVGRKDEFIATFTKPGYSRMDIPVKTGIATGGGAAFAGNILLGGLIGMGVDASTGATLEHIPNPVFAQLQPIQPPRIGKQRKIPADELTQ